jgi:Senescence-associated protein
LINLGSDAIKKLVGKNEKPIEIKPTTVAKFQAASATTKAVTSFTKAQISNAIDLAFNLGKQAKDEFVSSEKGATVTNNKYFIHAKIIGGGVLDLGIGIFAGLENAFTSVAQGTKGMTESVLEHKYGKDVKTVFAHSADAAWDIYQMKNVAKTKIVNKTGTNILDELNKGAYAKQPPNGPSNAFGSTGQPMKK